MQDFIMLFRQPQAASAQATPEEAEAVHKKWEEWIGNIAAQGRLGAGGSRLAPQGKVLKAAGVVTDGPFVEIREMLGGFIVVKANDLDDAITLAHGCPALDTGGSVEIRSEVK
jgi:hypothetical protein